MLDRSLEFVDIAGFGFHVTGIEIGDYFLAEIRCAPNAVSSQTGK